MASALEEAFATTLASRRLPVVLPVLAAVALSGLGLLVLLSIGRAHESGLGGYFFRQSLWLGIAVSAFVGTVLVNPLRWRKAAYGMAGGVVVLLLLVLVPGIGLEINGSRRWLDLGPMNLQVSDVAKIGFLFGLAHYLAGCQRVRGEWWRGFVLPCLLIGVFCILIQQQPDFGTALLFAVVGGLLLFLSGVSLWQLIPTGVLGLVAFGVAVVRDPVRLERILYFMDVEGNRSEGAYQLWQGLIGFALGGFNGVGLGNGRQQFAFLPEAHTDFIFPIIGEELGLVTTLLVVGLFGVVFGVVWHQLKRAPDLFQFLLVAGSLFFITIQAMVNIGVSTGCLPTKGMSLPFISYGGSNLVINYILLGIICRGMWNWGQPVAYRAREWRGEE